MATNWNKAPRVFAVADVYLGGEFRAAVVVLTPLTEPQATVRTLPSPEGVGEWRFAHAMHVLNSCHLRNVREVVSPVSDSR